MAATKIDYTISHFQNFDANFPTDYFNGKNKSKSKKTPASEPAYRTIPSSKSCNFNVKPKKENKFAPYIPSKVQNQDKKEENDKQEKTINSQKSTKPEFKETKTYNQQKPKNEDQGKKGPTFGNLPEKKNQNDNRHGQGNNNGGGGGGGRGHKDKDKDDRGKKRDTQRDSRSNHGEMKRSKSYTKSLTIGGMKAPIPSMPPK